MPSAAGRLASPGPGPGLRRPDDVAHLRPVGRGGDGAQQRQPEGAAEVVARVCERGCGAGPFRRHRAHDVPDAQGEQRASADREDRNSNDGGSGAGLVRDEREDPGPERGKHQPA